MFEDSTLQTYLTTSSTIKSQAAIVAEWNLNYITNIDEIGNYYYNPAVGGLSNTFAKETSQTSSPKYFGATESNIGTVTGFSDDGLTSNPFVKVNEREKLLYSLEDCFGRFRPRSGINKLRYFNNGFTHHTYSNTAKRPRYYMASKDDKFKYWSSYRNKFDATNKKNVEYGIATTPVSGTTAPYYIKDAVPFVTYKTPVPANRLVIKMQTNVGTEPLGSVVTSTRRVVQDPFYGTVNKTTPITWKVQVLQGNTWTDAKSFTSDIVPVDGYVELSYGITNIPLAYVNNFVYAGEYTSESLLPPISIKGYAYLIRSGTEIGQYRVWNGTSYDAAFTPIYGWYQSVDGLSPTSSVLTELVNAPSYVSGTTRYRDFQYIQGIRIVVDTMNKYNSIFDLIEMSPRLVADLSDITTGYTANKTLSDLSTGGIPVGQLLASNGTLSIFDSEQAFNPNNSNSIIKNFSTINLQIKFYEIVSQVNDRDYYVPIKTYYAEGFPEFDNESRELSISLRDLFFYFESMKAPQLFIRNASMSYVVSTLLDSIGFSNYQFKRNANETEEPIIPNFVVRPDATVAEILNDLAVSTQSAMFFDEYNNFTVMTRNRMMPTDEEKATDLVLVGSVDSTNNGIVKNISNGSAMSNIISVSTATKDIYNDGKISYTNRYIQRSYGSLAEAGQLNKDKRWVYKPALLWEVSGTENVRSVNKEFGNQSSYALGAIPLNTTLLQELPYVDSSKNIQNDIIDFGEAVYWLPRYKGYFYANGEIIRYDAVEYAVDGVGNVWISDVQEYEDYFQKVKFNGFIYPTGRVKIYAEPHYTSAGVIDDSIAYTDADGTYRDGTTRGAVAKHGRGQFGTSIEKHDAGLSSHWTNPNNIYGCAMNSRYLFATNTSRVYSGSSSAVSATPNAARVRDTKFTNLDNDSEQNYLILDATKSGKLFSDYNSNTLARGGSVNGIIKNFLNSNYDSEVPYTNAVDSSVPGTMQSSALIFNGRDFSSSNPIDFVSYIHKPLTDSYNHFGTRLRIIGKIENTEKESTARNQTGVGSSPIFTSNPDGSDEAKIVSGSSGGLGIMVNPTNNTGYFLEIVALTDQSTKAASGQKDIANVYFYKTLAQKTKSNGSPGVDNDLSIPVELYSGLTQILVDDGLFTGQAKIKGEQITSVYDISVEYETTASGLKFYLTINNNLIAIVEDTEPLPITQSLALFVRGSSRLMFENVYAIAQTDPYAASTGVLPVVSAEPFELDNPDSKYEHYGLSRVVKNTFLTKVNPSSPPKYKFYYDEFGTIMREAAYFNIRYDKAYPALLAKISPTFNTFKGYSISGFTPNAYGAEFLVFNTTDTVLNLDETSGNYLRIQGVTFTQESTHDLTVDEYFNKSSDFSNPPTVNTGVSPSTAKQTYADLMNSRSVHGKKDFSIQAPYIQNADTAYKLMDWMISRIMRPRRSIGIDMFAMPTIQLGDIVEINYTDKNSIVQAGGSSSRFIVYNIEFSKDGNGPSMKIYLSEVI
jgi:hypothetical protein